MACGHKYNVPEMNKNRIVLEKKSIKSNTHYGIMILHP